MTYTYTWTDAEHTALKRECAEMGTCAFVPVDAGNRDYAEFLAAGAVPAEYVAPPAPPELTPEEKLAASGLTVAELQTLLGL